MREGLDRLKKALMPFALAYDQAEAGSEGPCLDLVETRRMYETPTIQDYRRAAEAFASVDWDFTKIPLDIADKVERFQRDRSEWFSGSIREILSEYEEWRAASADTQPEAGDVQQAPLVSGAVGEAETPKRQGPMTSLPLQGDK